MRRTFATGVILAAVALIGWAVVAQDRREAAAFRRETQREWPTPTGPTTTTLDPCGPKAMAELAANEALGAADPEDPRYDPQADAALDDYCSASSRNAGDLSREPEYFPPDPPDPGGP